MKANMAFNYKRKRIVEIGLFYNKSRRKKNNRLDATSSHNIDQAKVFGKYIDAIFK